MPGVAATGADDRWGIHPLMLHTRPHSLALRSREVNMAPPVLGAMDTMYHRGKIQEESLYCEHKKHDGSLPLVGVNTLLPQRTRRRHRHRDRTDPLDRRRKGAAN